VQKSEPFELAHELPRRNRHPSQYKAGTSEVVFWLPGANEPIMKNTLKKLSKI